MPYAPHSSNGAQSRGGHLPFLGLPVDGYLYQPINEVCHDKTYGYLSSRRVSPPIHRYQIILLGVRGRQVRRTCPGFLRSRAPTPTPNTQHAHKSRKEIKRGKAEDMANAQRD